MLFWTEDPEKMPVRRIILFAFLVAFVSIFIFGVMIYFRKSDGLMHWMPLILSIETGMIFFLLWMLIAYWIEQANLKKREKNIQNSSLVVNTCPDYWTESRTARGDVICTNKYPDSTTPGRSFIIQGDSLTPNSRTINLSSFDGKSVQSVCSQIKSVASPWSSVSPMCG